MASCGLVNLGACLPEVFFKFVLGIMNAPIKALLNIVLDLLSEPINLSLFSSLWAIIIYVISMFYALLLIATGFNFIVSGHDVVKRERAKIWLRDIVIMVILVQASFFIYQLTIDLASVMTSATLSLTNTDFFIFTNDGSLGLALVFAVLYLITLALTAIILLIRYAVVSIGVVLFPLAIFFYFIPQLKAYGSLIVNFLGISIFVTFLNAVVIVGFSKLIDLSLFATMKPLVLVSAFLLIDGLMFFLIIFSVIKAGLSVYSDVKNFRSRF